MTINNEDQLNAAYRLLSPNFTPQYLINKYFPEADYGNEHKWVDLHSNLVMNLLKLPREGELIYHNAKPVTTHSQIYYNTVSLWWLIVACSDYVHPHCIPTNTLIKVPVLNVISSYLSKDVNVGLSGKIITI